MRDKIVLARNDGRMALAVNGEYARSRITVVDIIEEARSWGMRNPEPVVTEILERVSAFVRREKPDPRVYKNLVQDIRTFIRNLIEGKPAMESEGR